MGWSIGIMKYGVHGKVTAFGIAPIGGQLGFARQELGRLGRRSDGRAIAPHRGRRGAQGMLEGGSWSPSSFLGTLALQHQAPQPRRDSMDKYIGIDVHAASCTIAVVDARGKQTGSHVVATNGQEIGGMPSAAIPDRDMSASGRDAEWMALRDSRTHAVEVVVAGVEAGRRGPKDDKRDAFGLAEDLRQGAIKTAFSRMVVRTKHCANSHVRTGWWSGMSCGQRIGSKACIARVVWRSPASRSTALPVASHARAIARGMPWAGSHAVCGAGCSGRGAQRRGEGAGAGSTQVPHPPNYSRLVQVWARFVRPSWFPSLSARIVSAPSASSGPTWNWAS